VLDGPFGIVARPHVGHGSMPVGSIANHEFLVQQGYAALVCDGAEYDPEAYPELHVVLSGSDFPPGRLPDLRSLQPTLDLEA